jgi:hypothetical protein
MWKSENFYTHELYEMFQIQWDSSNYTRTMIKRACFCNHSSEHSSKYHYLIGLFYMLFILFSINTVYSDYNINYKDEC